MFDFLDNPRKSLYNLAQGLGEGDLGRALPGLLGAGLTGGLAATGFGLPVAMLAGSALGGIGQSIFGKEAMTPSDLLGKITGASSDGVGSFLLGAATDPLTYAGLGLGRQGGRVLGRGLDKTAEMLGPRYGTTADDFLKMAGQHVDSIKSDYLDRMGKSIRDSDLADRIEPIMSVLKSPHAERILSEIHPQSKIIGNGMEAFAAQAPTGGVTRVGKPLEFFEGVPKGRPNVPEVLQPSRSVSVPLDEFEAHLIEHSPFADVVGDKGWRTYDKSLQRGIPSDAGMIGGKVQVFTPEYAQTRSELAQRMRDRGLSFDDPHPGNVGYVGGQPKIIDSGAFSVQPEYTGSFSPVIDAMQSTSPRSMLLHKLLASDAAMQRAVESGLANPNYQRYYGRLGGGLGAAIGAEH